MNYERMGMILDRLGATQLNGATAQAVSELPALPIGRDIFGNQFCTTLAGRGSGGIQFWLHDAANRIPLARSFSGFLEGLVEDDDALDPDIDSKVVYSELPN